MFLPMCVVYSVYDAIGVPVHLFLTPLPLVINFPEMSLLLASTRFPITIRTSTHVYTLIRACFHDISHIIPDFSGPTHKCLVMLSHPNELKVDWTLVPCRFMSEEWGITGNISFYRFDHAPNIRLEMWKYCLSYVRTKKNYVISKKGNNKSCSYGQTRK